MNTSGIMQTGPIKVGGSWYYLNPSSGAMQTGWMEADGKKYYEIDFLIADEHKISPIEVKSSGYKSHTSLDVFCDKFSDRVQNKYVIYTKDLKREQGIDYIPVYMTMFL